MYIPILPTVAIVGFAGLAAKYSLRKQWQNAVICLLCGLMAFLVIQGLTSNPAGLDEDRARITALEQKVLTLEGQLQRLQQSKGDK